MKKIHYKLSLLLLFSMVNFNVQAQNMYMRPTTGTFSTFPIESIGKLTFNNGNLLVTNSTGPNASFAIADLRYLTFNAALSTTEQVPKSARSFYAYPNPVSNFLNLSTADSSVLVGSIQVISVEGRLLLQQNEQPSSSKTIDVSALPQGLYLCKVTSGNLTQTIKFLKQ